MSTVRQRLLVTARAFGEGLSTPDLRRLQLAWVGSVLGHYLYVVALGVYAFGEGGAAAVGLVGVLRLLLPAVAAPVLTALADRARRELVMIASNVIRGILSIGAAAVIALDGPAPVVYAIVAASGIAATVFRPAQAALLPVLVSNPTQLSSANVASSTVESVGSLAGPALGGILLAFTNVETVFVVNALTFVWSTGLLARIHTPAPEPTAGSGEQPTLLADITAGGSTIARDPELRLIAGLYSAQTLIAGAASVFTVTVALDLLETGPSGVGWLISAAGVGGLLGGLVALVLAARGRLAADLALGLVLNGLPFALIAVWPTQATALLAMVVVGVGNSVTDVSAITLLQRAVPDAVLARVLGAIESLLLASLGLGALLAPLLIALVGIRTSLLVAGVFAPLVVALCWLGLRRIDAPAPVAEHVRLLEAIPIFSPLPPVKLERLASQLGEQTLPSGTLILRRGDPGDRFYVIADGEVEIEGRRYRPGDFFGEIALLRDVPRTASVQAATDVRLLTLDRDEFLAAVTGHEPSAAAAEAVVTARLGSLRPEVASA